MKTFKEFTEINEDDGYEVPYVPDEEWGVRWTEFDKKDRQIAKEKFFNSEQKRTQFINKLQQKDNFAGILAYSDPIKK